MIVEFPANFPANQTNQVMWTWASENLPAVVWPKTFRSQNRCFPRSISFRQMRFLISLLTQRAFFLMGFSGNFTIAAANSRFDDLCSILCQDSSEFMTNLCLSFGNFRLTADFKPTRHSRWLLMGFPLFPSCANQEQCFPMKMTFSFHSSTVQVSGSFFKTIRNSAWTS